MKQISLTNYPLAKIFKIEKSEIEKIDFSLCNQPRETLESYYKRQSTKPDLMCNGGFFDMNTGNTIFTYKDNDKTIIKRDDLLYGIGTINNQLVYGRYNAMFKDFVNGYPVLIENSLPINTTIAKNLDYNARRTVLAYDKDYIYVIAVESPGYDFSKIKKMLLELKVVYAINLDGGGSTRILKEGKCVTNTSIVNRPVDNVICFYFKKNLFRVQTGAFSKKENAENLKNKIVKLDDSIGAGYKNAYIRLINGLYKVQVGAFSKKENAEKVSKDLHNKGFNSFITTE